MYKNRTADSLSNVELNHDLILCDNTKCDSETHRNAIQRMYDYIIISLKSASEPLCKQSNKSNNYDHVMGWNEYCKVSHEQAREAYLIWRDDGKKRHGILFDSMKRSRAYFKYALRKCKCANCNKSADMLASTLLTKDDKHFWKEVKKVNSDSGCIPNTVNNVTGARNITGMWKDHYENIFNSSTDTSFKNIVENVIINPHKGT